VDPDISIRGGPVFLKIGSQSNYLLKKIKRYGGLIQNEDYKTW
jgi:hypothetical protein